MVGSDELPVYHLLAGGQIAQLRGEAGRCDLPHTCMIVEVLLLPMLFDFLGTNGGHCFERRRRN